MWEALLNLALTQGCTELKTFRYCVQINLQNKSLVLYEDQQIVNIYPVAIGKPATPTPRGNFFIFERSNRAGWRNTNGTVISYNHPRNPMTGVYLGWAKGEDGIPYGIHGTNVRSSIGKAISGGCIRLFPEDIREIYPKIFVGTPVLIR